VRHHLFLVALVSISACDSKDGTSAAASSKPTTTTASACPASYGDVPDAQRASALTCSCAPEAVRGSVWGSGVYTTDSSICAAARHAGVLAAGAGGEVTVQGSKG
jgi:hypothetical protein